MSNCESKCHIYIYIIIIIIRIEKMTLPFYTRKGIVSNGPPITPKQPFKLTERHRHTKTCCKHRRLKIDDLKKECIVFVSTKHMFFEFLPLEMSTYYALYRKGPRLRDDLKHEAVHVIFPRVLTWGNRSLQ